MAGVGTAGVGTASVGTAAVGVGSGSGFAAIGAAAAGIAGVGIAGVGAAGVTATTGAGVDSGSALATAGAIGATAGATDGGNGSACTTAGAAGAAGLGSGTALAEKVAGLLVRLPASHKATQPRMATDALPTATPRKNCREGANFLRLWPSSRSSNLSTSTARFAPSSPRSKNFVSKVSNLSFDPLATGLGVAGAERLLLEVGLI
jgi:hypothetical protein